MRTVNDIIALMVFKYNTILFDFDGTLTPSLPLWMRSYQYAFEQLGVNLTSEEVVRKCFYRPWSELVQTYKLPSREAFALHVRDGLEDAFAEAVLFDGVMEFLDTCRADSIKLGIVTSCHRSIVQRFLDTHKMRSYFGTVVTSDDVVNHKPHPEPVETALKQIGAPAERALLVGDSHVDLLAAAASGLHSALFFPSGHDQFYDFDHLLGHEPHYVFHRYSELISHVTEQQAGVG